MITNQYASNGMVPAVDMVIKMPRGGATIFSDLIIKLDVLYVYFRASSASVSRGSGG
jgi:hypothetical protein